MRSCIPGVTCLTQDVCCRGHRVLVEFFPNNRRNSKKVPHLEMFGWNFSQLFKEGSQALRGKVFLWVMFLLPTAILGIQRGGGGLGSKPEVSFNAASLMPLGTFHSFQWRLLSLFRFCLPLALQSKFQLYWKVCWAQNPLPGKWAGAFHSAYIYCDFLSLNRAVLGSPQAVSTVLCSHLHLCRDKVSLPCANVQGCRCKYTTYCRAVVLSVLRQ